MAGPKKAFVTVVSGLPRSGTSMMMKMIEAGGMTVLTDHIRAPDQDNPKGYYEFEPVKKTQADASWLEQARGKVVKMVHLLLLDLPLTYQYRVVFMRRHLDEVIESQNIMLERKGVNGGDLPVERMKKIFLAQINKVSDYVNDHGNFQMLQVDYNEIMSDPAPAVQRVNQLLGGDLDTAAMTAVVDPTLYRNRST